MIHDLFNEWIISHIGLVCFSSAFIGFAIGVLWVHKVTAEAYLDGVKVGEQRGYDRAKEYFSSILQKPPEHS